MLLCQLALVEVQLLEPVQDTKFLTMKASPRQIEATATLVRVRPCRYAVTDIHHASEDM